LPIMKRDGVQSNPEFVIRHLKNMYFLNKINRNVVFRR
jgi:hypothetical protein